MGATARRCRAAAQLAAGAALLIAPVAAGTSPSRAEDMRFALPLACEPQKTCFVQHYVDVAPEAGTQDYGCGHSTYKRHDGVDFRVLSAAAAKAGVPVLAAAPGVVKGRRDGMTDAFARETGKEAVKDRECGNGVVIDHGNGWTTQYCHMRQGSVKVISGQTVERGQQLGEVGYSGLADTAHLHLTVRLDGKPVDPFTGKRPDGTCLLQPDAAVPLFEPSVVSGFPYVDGVFLQSGFASRQLSWQELEVDHTTAQDLSPTSDALVFFARITHLRGGDRIQVVLKGPGGFDFVSPGTPVEGDKAIYLATAGRKRKEARWPVGVYEGEATLVRDGQAIRTAKARVEMR